MSDAQIDAQKIPWKFQPNPSSRLGVEAQLAFSDSITENKIDTDVQRENPWSWSEVGWFIS